MAQSRLTRRYLAKLEPGQEIQENGIAYRAGDGGDGTWYIVFRDQNGRRHRQKVGRVSQDITLDQVRDALSARMGAVVEGKFEIASSKDIPTVKVFYEQEYLPWSKANKRSWRGDQRCIEAHVVRTFGAKALNEVTRAEVERWKVELLEGRAPATVNRVFALLRHMFNQAVGWGYLKNSPCRGVRQFKADNTRVRFLQGKELARLLEAAGVLADGAVVDGKKKHGYPWLRPLITVAVNTGLRFGELAKLTWSDVDMENRILTLRETKDGTTARTPFNDEVWLTLATLERVDGNDHVFPGRGPSGRLDNVKKSFKAALDLAKIENFRFHDLRHTFASHLVMAGVDLNTVRELMRHKTLDMTLRYAHLAPEHKQAALAKIAAVCSAATAETATVGPDTAQTPEVVGDRTA